MAYRELTDLRGPVSSTWFNDVTKRRTLEMRLKTYLHQSSGDRVHISPTHVSTAAFEGWTFDQGDLTFGVGARTGLGDGWCGVQYGAVRLWLKLARLMWYHAPSNGVQLITLAAPVYNRSLITSTPQVLTIGPDGGQAEVTVAQDYTWHGQWTTPGGGELYTRWHNESRKLKMEPVITQAARAWVAANAMPTNGAWLPKDTYLAFAYELDTSEVPSWALAGVARALLDMDDAGGNIQARDAAGQLAFYLSLGTMWSTGDTEATVQMRQKVINYGGKNYLLAGATLSQIAPLAAGDLVFDPSLVLEEGAGGSMDVTIRNGAGSTFNYGISTAVLTGHASADGESRRTLIKFDLSTVPDVFTHATLSLYCSSDYSDNARACRMFRQKRAWVEGTRDGVDSPATGATWARYDTTNSWSSAGGFHADDCEQVDIGSRAFTATETLNVFKDFVFTPTTKADLDLGNGWLLKMDTENDDLYAFSSSDHATAAYRPKLVVDYPWPGGGDALGNRTFTPVFRGHFG